MKALFETPPKPVIPVEFGKQMPDWGFHRKHGERNCDGMIHKGSIFDPKNGAWVMCTRKAKHTDEISGLQFCPRHMKRRPPNTCTHAQATQIQTERAIMWKQNQELLRAGQERPFLKLLDRQQTLVEKDINREWRAALSWLSKAVANSLECWVDTLPLYRENRSDLGTTLHMLHGQACALARAIVKHCRSGELQSAIILWRSLFEIEVNMAYIAKDTTQVPSRAKRYYDWNMANYFYVNGLFSHETMIELQRKYKGWNLKHYDGWTAPPDNKRELYRIVNTATKK